MTSAALIVGIGGIVVTMIGADLLHDVLAMQLQFFRAAWLMHLFGNFAVAMLVFRLWQRRVNAVPLIGMIAIAWVTFFMLAPGFGVVLSVFAAVLAAAHLRYSLAPVSKAFVATICGFAAVVVTAAFGLRIYITAQRTMTASSEGSAPPEVFLHIAPIDVIVALILFATLVRLRPGKVNAALPFAVGIMAVLAVVAWDRRDQWGRGIEGDFDVSALQSLIPPDATVYFELDTRGAWLMLERATYGSVMQGAGINFNRDSAIASAHATRDLTPILGREPMDIFRREDDNSTHQVPLNRTDIDIVGTAASDLDFMILSRQVEGAYSATWMPSTPLHNVRALTRGKSRPPIASFYLYDCRNLRRIAKQVWFMPNGSRPAPGPVSAGSP